MRTIRDAMILAIGVFFLFAIATNQVCAEGIPVVSRGETFQLSVLLLENVTYGNPLPNQIVYFYDQTNNNLLTSAITDNNGFASINHAFSIDYPLGYTLVNITYKGNESLSLAPSCQWITLLITSFTSISVDFEENQYAPGDTLNLQVSLLDDQGYPVRNAILSALYNSVPISSGITNTTGHANFQIVLSPEIFALGTHIIELVYGGNSTSFLRGSSTSFEIDIRKVQTSIILTENLSNLIMLNQTFRTSIGLVGNGRTLADSTLEILLDGHYLDTINTNSTGHALIDIFLGENVDIGNHIITLEYSGTLKYEPSYMNLEIQIGTAVSIHVTTENLAIIDTNLKFKITTLDIFLRPLPFATISISDPTTNTTISSTIDNQSSIDITLPITGPRGPRIFFVNVTYGVLLRNNTILHTLDIWTKPRIEIIDTNILGYASISQNLVLSARLRDYRGALPNRVLNVLPFNIPSLLPIVTDSEGKVAIQLESPSIEGQYYIIITSEGNVSDYEQPCQTEFSFIVSSEVPIQISLHQYTIIVPLNVINVQLRIQALNGSYLHGIRLAYRWMASGGISSTNIAGIADIALPIPSNPGIHELQYNVSSDGGIKPSLGVVHIIITLDEANSTEGIGIYGLIAGFSGSIGVAAIPLVRRRFVYD